MGFPAFRSGVVASPTPAVVVALTGVVGTTALGSFTAPGNIQSVTHAFRVALLNGLHAFGTSVVRGSTTSDSFKAALYVTTATQNAATTTYAVSGEVAGTGYTAGGITVSNANPPSNLGSTAFWTPSAALVFSSVTLSTAFDALLLYNSTSAAKLSVAVFTFGAQTVTAGNFVMSMPANNASTGLLRLT